MLDPLFDFIGSYWWLAFIFGGSIVGGVKGIAAWSDRRARLRHEQRIELMRTKAEVEALTGATPAALEASDQQVRRDRLARLLESHDDVSRRWLDYELDEAKRIAFPAMSDGGDPFTAVFLRARQKADALRPAPDADLGVAELGAYRDAVHGLEDAFDAAAENARRLRGDRG